MSLSGWEGGVVDTDRAPGILLKMRNATGWDLIWWFFKLLRIQDLEIRTEKHYWGALQLESLLRLVFVVVFLKLLRG